MTLSIILHHRMSSRGRRLPFRFAAKGFFAAAYFVAASRPRHFARLRTAAMLLCLVTLPLINTRAGAQTGTASPSSHNAAGKGPTAGRDAKTILSNTGGDTGEHEVPTLNSVREDVLKPLQDQEVRVQGIIGDYHQTTTRYNFHMNDQSEVEVIGSYPAAAHTTYILNARVVREGAKYVLSEIRKERVDGGSLKADPLLVSGILLLVAAAVIFIVMTARSKTAQKQGMEPPGEQEPRKAEAARQEGERLRSASGEPGRDIAAPAPQFAAAGAGGSRAAPPRTLVSVGSVEVISGLHRGDKFPLLAGETPIGRAVKDGISLDRDGVVSSSHGRLTVNNGRVLYRDDSANGSLLDGIEVHHAEAEVRNGSELEIGASTLRITLRATALDPARQAEPAEPIQAVVSSPAAAPAAAEISSGQSVPVSSVPSPPRRRVPVPPRRLRWQCPSRR